MATFRFGHYIDIHWNGYDIVGDGGTIFSIPDQLYEEFEGDLRPVEPTLEWIDTNEFLTLQNSVTNYTVVATSPISVASTTSTKTWSLIDGGVTSAKIADLAVNAAKINSQSATNGYVLTANGSAGAAWAAQTGSGGGISALVGTDPISATVVGANATVSLNANYSTSTHLHASTYQPLGTYVTSVAGTAPVVASTDTAGAATISVSTGVTSATLSLGNHTHEYQPTGTYVTSVVGTSPISASGTTAITVTIDQAALDRATTLVYGYTTLVDSVTSTSVAAAATPNSARIANTAATSAQITADAATVSAAAAQTTANARVATVTGDAAIGSTGTTAIALAHTTTDGYRHVPVTSTTNNGKFLKSGATAGSEAWAAVAMSDITTGNYIATATGSTGVTITGSGSNAGAAVISIGQAVATTSNVTFVNVTGTGIISSSNISSGRVNITPVANATTGAAVTGLSIKTSAGTATGADISIVVTADAGSDAVRTTSMNNPTFTGSNCTGFTAQVFRTNTTVTTINWIAIGR
jgi:hypothetical protein